jgi:hypothetical protein
MGQRSSRLHVAVQSAILISVVLASSGSFAQGRGGQPPSTAKAAARIDLTGHWVAEVTEDWRWRMVTPAKGDYMSIPINPAAQKVADVWDPAKDEAAGEQCRAYGAPALMRAPTRLNISWLDDNTLKVEADYGTQTRLLHFGSWKPPGGAPTWQGESVAHWEVPTGRGATGTSLVVTTSKLRPGYLRKNGVPYSAQTTMTEYWDLVKERNGEQRILLTIVVEDPQYLQVPWVVPVHFKKEADGAKWDPQPCSARF